MSKNKFTFVYRQPLIPLFYTLSYDTVDFTLKNSANIITLSSVCDHTYLSSSIFYTYFKSKQMNAPYYTEIFILDFVKKNH